jgi:two-component sensor histidine kinase
MGMPRSLRLRLWLYAALTSLPLLAVAVGYAAVLIRQQSSVVVEDMLRDTQSVADVMDNQIRQSKALVETVAGLVAQGSDPEALKQIAQATLHPQGANLTIHDIEGRMTFNAMLPPDQLPEASANSDFLRRILSEGGTAVSGVMAGIFSADPFTAVATPLRVHGNTTGVLSITMRHQQLASLVSRHGLLPSATWALVDEDGGIVTRSDGRLVGTRLPTDMLERTLGERGSQWTQSFDGRRIVRTWVRMREANWFVAMGVDQAVVVGPLRWTVMAGLGALTAALVIAGLLAGLLQQAIVTPVKQLLDIAANPRAGLAPPPQGVDDFEVLGRTLIAQARQHDVLRQELDHRARNLLTVVQGLVRSTVRAPASIDEARGVLLGRIAALGCGTMLLEEAKQRGGELHSLVTNTMSAFSGRYDADGAAISLTPQAALNFALVLHELATNAVKHGALSSLAGHVAIKWCRSDAGLTLTWRETGGPPLEGRPKRRGLGTQLIERALGAETAVDLDYAATGLQVTITLPANFAIAI